jgi:hypothetical protein
MLDCCYQNCEPKESWSFPSALTNNRCGATTMAKHAPITGVPARTPDTSYIAVTRFCRMQGMTHSRFGRNAINDPALVMQMREGRTIRAATRARIEAYMASMGRA